MTSITLVSYWFDSAGIQTYDLPQVKPASILTDDVRHIGTYVEILDTLFFVFLAVTDSIKLT